MPAARRQKLSLHDARPASEVNAHASISVNPQVGTPEARYRCPCCGFRTLETPATMALCPVCWWEDDGQEDDDADDIRNTVNGALSLDEARLHFAHCGAAHPRFLPYVRKPEMTEQ